MYNVFSIAAIFDFCEKEGVLKTLNILGIFIMIIKILIPLLLIILGTIDYGQAVIASDENAIQKATTTLTRRLIAGIIIFFIPTIINFVASLLTGWNSIESEFSNCQTCLFKLQDCNKKIINAQLKNACIQSKGTTYYDELNQIDCKNNSCTKDGITLSNCSDIIVEKDLRDACIKAKKKYYNNEKKGITCYSGKCKKGNKEISCD